ncbi:MAG: hypothetical protein AB7P78_12625 [Candidatus Binatia bacterium]
MRRLGLFLLAVAALGACSRSDRPVGTPLTVQRLQLEIPQGWRLVRPSGGMRSAQAVIDGPGGPAEFVIFHFGARQGGDVEANVRRWLAQIEPAPGIPPRREQLESDGLRITFVDAEGTFLGSGMGTGAQPTPQRDARLLGAVIEGEGGPWFLKATGPDSTLAAQRMPFIQMLQSARLAP